MWMRREHLGLGIQMLGVLVWFAASAHGQAFEVDWWTVDGGGEMSSTGGVFEVAGTIGQPDAGELTGGEFSLQGGFFVLAYAPADWDCDGDVDAADFEAFRLCATGAAIPYGPGCGDKDLDNDGDVDQSDFGILQRCYSGENNPADPNCTQ